MAWTTATIAEKTRREGALTLRIVYGRDDSPETATEHVEFRTPPDVVAFAKAGLARLNAILVADEQIRVGPIAIPPDPGDEEPPPPTKDEVDRALFAEKAAAYRAIQKAADNGLATADAVGAAKAEMQAAFKPGYESILLGLP